MKFKPLVAALCLTACSLSNVAFAKKHAPQSGRIVQGAYTVISGSVETLDVSADPTKLEQLGTYDILLKNTEWNSLPWYQKFKVRKYVRISGTLKGTIDLTELYSVGPIVSHVMIDDDRATVIRSANDVFYPLSGDLQCSNGEPMEILEYVNVASATGKYENLVAGSIVLSGTVNNCPSLTNFGKYDLSVVPGESTIIFE